MKEIPPDLLNIINKHQANSPECFPCNYSCCFQSGFALRENVNEIYKLYTQGLLIRDDYSFKSELSIDEFISIYFDVIRNIDLNLTLYFPRHLAYNDVALIIPFENGMDFWSTRHDILINPINECKGCIFLENRMSLSDQSSKKCILHDYEKPGYISAKPIDCVLLSCDSNRKVKKMEKVIEDEYFILLANYFHD